MSPSSAVYSERAYMSVWVVGWIAELTALQNVRWWHRNIARQGFAINGFIKHYPDILRCV